MNKIIFALLTLLISSNGFAVGHVLNAKVTTVYCGYEESYKMCSITFDKPIVDKDSCHTSSERLQFKPNTDIGRAILSIALSAQASQSKVDVYTTGKCTIFSGLADVNWITIKND